MSQPARASIRLAELLGVLSLAADLGLGQPMEHALRQCLISMRLAQQLGLDEADRGVVYYASLLAWVGCHVDAQALGDEDAEGQSVFTAARRLWAAVLTWPRADTTPDTVLTPGLAPRLLTAVLSVSSAALSALVCVWN